MSPIEGISDVVRMPRLGKIHLGIKVERPGKRPYPKATDYFVVPSEVAEFYGEQPKELSIMFPTEDSSQFSQQWLRAYSTTQGLVCIGDGQTSRRKVDVATGAMAGHETEQWEWIDGLPCDPQECDQYMAKRCRRVMNLQFLLPDVSGLGVWQIDTTSFYSILNINSMVKLLKGILGRCSMLPLTLVLGPIEVSPPGIKTKTVHVMHLKQDIKLSALAQIAQLPPAKVLLAEPYTDEVPLDLFPEEVLDPTGEVARQEQEATTGIVEGQGGEACQEDRDRILRSIANLGWAPLKVTAYIQDRCENKEIQTVSQIPDDFVHKIANELADWELNE